jgi:hypothetical protein
LFEEIPELELVVYIYRKIAAALDDKAQLPLGL